jgi:8-oxo-dGTP diphosphatase
MQPDVPNSFYRVSAKALILDETRKKFLIVLEDNGLWEIPGGGLDWGENPQTCIKREIKEEMGLTVTDVSVFPSYFLVGENMKGVLSVNVVFETKVEDLNFTPSAECLEMRFVSPDEVKSLNAFRTVQELATLFTPSKHST